jgi:DNA polymerase zeta
MAMELSRVFVNVNASFGEDKNEYGFNHNSGIISTGRIWLNVWRLMRSELTLTSYSLENTVFHALHER